MGPATWAAIYMTVWWTVLFGILPIGVQSYSEAGIKPPGGGDPGAPVEPKLKRKFITTTWVSALVCLGLAALLHFHVVDLSRLPLR